MSANFTPDMTGYKGLSPFRFWCQKTLPLVYDDSLSYYELLCKVVNYINNLITDVAAAEENVDKLLTAYNQLQEYVNNYFDGADFQQKIDDSLDRYAEDGTLSAMVNTHVRALLPYEVGQQIGPVVDEDLGPVVDLKLPAVVESKIAAPVATQLPAVVQDQIGGVVGNQISDVVADQIDEVVADQITDAVSPLVHDEVTGLIRPAVATELPAALQVYLPPEVQTQLPGAIGTDLETIAPPVIENWLDAHPEATTSVPDGSISFNKLATDLQRTAGISNNYFPADFTNEYAWQVNQYAVYQGRVYRCIKTTTAGQVWNASEWTTANMNSDLFYMWWCLNYLSQSITTIDSSPATSAHEAGEYFIYYDGVHLYRLAKASSNIAVGDTLTPNGNFIYSSVENMIADLKVEIADLKSNLGDISGKTRNINTAQIGRYRMDNNDSIIASANSYCGFDAPVPCEAETTYTGTWYNLTDIGTWYVKYLNAQKQRIHADTITGAKLSETFTTPENTAYIYIDMYRSAGITINSDTAFQLEEGTKSTSYIKPFTADDEIARQNASKALDDSAEALARLITAENDISGINDALDKTVGVGIGTNLFNPNDFILNKRLYLTQVGNEQRYTDNQGTDIVKIKVAPNTDYTFYGVALYSIVDADNKVLVATTSTDSNTSHTITTPAVCDSAWFEVVHNLAYQLNIGSSLKKYEPYAAIEYITKNGTHLLNVKDLPYIQAMDDNSVVSPDMTKAEFIAAFNGAMADLATLCKCFSASFTAIPPVSGTSPSWELIYETINHNLRDNVVSPDMSFEMACNNINKTLQKPIYRFCDARLGSARNFSLSTGLQADEPSAIVSDDGETLYIYAHLKRISSVDGVNWSAATPLVLSDSGYVAHACVNYIDGVYYLFGTSRNNAGDFILYTSTDGINFTYRGVLFANGYEFVNGRAVTDFGNGYLIKEYGSGKYYIYVEYQATGINWEISLATCDDIFHDNGDGTIGDWVNSSHNPVLAKPHANYFSGVSTAGIADFAKGVDNRPIKRNGKYYMYFHSTISQVSYIFRAYSYDLETWVNEGIIFDNRDQPSAGDETSGNADQCIIEFKGRTYLFYTWNINTSLYQPYIKYTIDDRPMSELLDIRP